MKPAAVPTTTQKGRRRCMRCDPGKNFASRRWDLREPCVGADVYRRHLRRVNSPDTVTVSVYLGGSLPGPLPGTTKPGQCYKAPRTDNTHSSYRGKSEARGRLGVSCSAHILRVNASQAQQRKVLACSRPLTCNFFFWDAIAAAP